MTKPENIEAVLSGRPESGRTATSPVEPEAKISISASELQQLLISAISTAVEKSNDKLAEALLESRKPYTSPEQQANERSMQEQMRAQLEQIRVQIRASQDSCEHVQGGNPLSDYPSPHGLTAIIRHQLDTGEIIGICTNCQRIFRFSDPDYRSQLQRKSGNRMSQAGQRIFTDPLAAIRAGQMHDS